MNNTGYVINNHSFRIWELCSNFDIPIVFFYCLIKKTLNKRVNSLYPFFTLKSCSNFPLNRQCIDSRFIEQLS